MHCIVQYMCESALLRRGSKKLQLLQIVGKTKMPDIFDLECNWDIQGCEV